MSVLEIVRQRAEDPLCIPAEEKVIAGKEPNAKRSGALSAPRRQGAGANVGIVQTAVGDDGAGQGRPGSIPVRFAQSEIGAQDGQQQVP